ncbi:MAG: hypothetical protein HC774_06235 [Sphingomonadales bacterium]|nr:hypothetical protein [Sphingomonadales bacterium]
MTGLHLDRHELRGAQGLERIAGGALILPVIAGVIVAMPLNAAFGGALVGSRGDGAYIAAVAILMSVTALPVLVALMREIGVLSTPFGQRALALPR